MRRLSKSVKGNEILRQLVAEIPWGQNLVILNKIKDYQEQEGKVVDRNFEVS